MKILLLKILLLMIFGISCSSNNRSETMNSQIEAYIAAHNDHDLKKVLSFLSDAFELHFTEYGIKMDKKEMVNVMGWDKGVNGRVSYKNLVAQGDSITGLFTEKNDFFTLVGIDDFKAQITFAFDRSGLITK